MNNIFWGFLLALIDFDITFGNANIDILPDFIGFILIFNGLVEMSHHSFHFSRGIQRAKITIALSAVIYILDVFGLSDILPGILTGALGLVYAIMCICSAQDVVNGILDMEARYGVYLNGQSLRSAWSVWRICFILTYIFLVTIILAIFSAIAILVSCIADICFLVALNRAKHAYYNLYL